MLVPCYNEGADHRSRDRGIPAGAARHAWFTSTTNCSTDGTGDVARAAGAVCAANPGPARGIVVRRMFAEIDADIYVVTDGDATYDATRAPEMVAALISDDLRLQ